MSKIWSYFKNLVLIALGIFIIFIGSEIFSFGEVPDDEFPLFKIIGSVFILSGIGCVIGGIYQIMRIYHDYRIRCKECGKWFAVECVKKETKGSFGSSKKESMDIRNNRGEKTGSYDQVVPTTVYYGTLYMKCTNCEHEYSQNYRNEY